MTLRKITSLTALKAFMQRLQKAAVRNAAEKSGRQ